MSRRWLGLVQYSRYSADQADDGRRGDGSRTVHVPRHLDAADVWQPYRQVGQNHHVHTEAHHPDIKPYPAEGMERQTEEGEGMRKERAGSLDEWT